METQNKKSAGGFNVYEKVTKAILASMMAGEIPWRKAWTVRKGGQHPFTNRFTGKPYSFLNTLLLQKPGQWATFNQIKKAGGNVRKGSKSRMVVKWGDYIPEKDKEEARRLEAEGKSIDHLKKFYLKPYNVFHMDDVEGLEAVEPEQMVSAAAEAPTDIADMVARDYRYHEAVKVTEDASADPAYLPDTDTVTIPPKDAFAYEEDWYASLFEQLVHSTAKESRCGRTKEIDLMKDGEGISVKEELIGEIGSSMILSVAGLEKKETHQQIAAECQRWVEEMNRDYRLIVNAASGAEKAAKLILRDFAA